MKFVVNISSIVIMLLSLSTITSAQGQQRPSQRSFATVLSKIKEKKSGRDKQQRQNQQPEDKLEGSNNQPMESTLQPIDDNSPAKPAIPREQPASRQPMVMPSKPRSGTENL